MGLSATSTRGGAVKADVVKPIPYSDVCGKCGATRIDQQLGLEPTPEQYVTRMVEVFREVRRVLADHGTVWLNLGDSYASSPPGNVAGVGATSGLHGANDASGTYRETLKAGHATKRNTIVGDLKQKDLCGIPWMVAFALRADGWYLRSDIIWAKPNPMPESVTDRPTKAHEYVFLLSKQPRYFFDQEAVREASIYPDDDRKSRSANGQKRHPTDVIAGIRPGSQTYPSRNIRSVWEIATQPYPEAHFATFPEELARRCIAAGCPEQVCRVCGKARERVVERELVATRGKVGVHKGEGPRPDPTGMDAGTAWDHSGGVYGRYDVTTTGFTDCGHDDYRTGTVLDPFIGSGTVAYVARKLGRHAVGIDLNKSYLELAARRLQQQSLFAEVASGL